MYKQCVRRYQLQMGAAAIAPRWRTQYQFPTQICVGMHVRTYANGE